MYSLLYVSLLCWLLSHRMGRVCAHHLVLVLFELPVIPTVPAERFDLLSLSSATTATNSHPPAHKTTLPHLPANHSPTLLQTCIPLYESSIHTLPAQFHASHFRLNRIIQNVVLSQIPSSLLSIRPCTLVPHMYAQFALLSSFSKIQCYSSGCARVASGPNPLCSVPPRDAHPTQPRRDGQ